MVFVSLRIQQVKIMRVREAQSHEKVTIVKYSLSLPSETVTSQAFSKQNRGRVS